MRFPGLSGPPCFASSTTSRTLSLATCVCSMNYLAAQRKQSKLPAGRSCLTAGRFFVTPLHLAYTACLDSLPVVVLWAHGDAEVVAVERKHVEVHVVRDAATKTDPPLHLRQAVTDKSKKSTQRPAQRGVRWCNLPCPAPRFVRRRGRVTTAAPSSRCCSPQSWGSSSRVDRLLCVCGWCLFVYVVQKTRDRVGR
jgi:hypothetical protein